MLYQCISINRSIWNWLSEYAGIILCRIWIETLKYFLQLLSKMEWVTRYYPIEMGYWNRVSWRSLTHECFMCMASLSPIATVASWGVRARGKATVRKLQANLGSWFWPPTYLCLYITGWTTQTSDLLLRSSPLYVPFVSLSLSPRPRAMQAACWATLSSGGWRCAELAHRFAMACPAQNPRSSHLKW